MGVRIKPTIEEAFAYLDFDSAIKRKVTSDIKMGKFAEVSIINMAVVIQDLRAGRNNVNNLSLKKVKGRYILGFYMNDTDFSLEYRNIAEKVI